MQSSSPASKRASSSCVQRDFPPGVFVARACSGVVWLWSPAVVIGWMDVETVGAVRARRDLKSSVWARARAEARVPIRRVRGGEEEEGSVGCWRWGGEEESVGVWRGAGEEGSVGGCCAGREAGGGAGGGAEDEEVEDFSMARTMN